MVKPYFERDGVALHHAQAEDILSTLPDASADLIATDPPYFRVKDEPWDRQWDSREGFLSWLGSIADQWRRVLKPNGSLYVFASPDLAWHVEAIVRERFSWLNTIRWEKEAGWHNKADEEALRSYLSNWEAVIFAEQHGASGLTVIGERIRSSRERAGLKGTDVDVALGYVRRKDATRGTELCRRWEEGSSVPAADDYCRALRACGDERPDEALRGEYEALRGEYEALRRSFTLDRRSPRTDIWRFATVKPYPHKHPCEKPLALMEHIVTTSSRPGDLVLDCFSGSGTTLRACLDTGRRAIGVEASALHVRQSAHRLSQLSFGLEVPA